MRVHVIDDGGGRQDAVAALLRADGAEVVTGSVGDLTIVVGPAEAVRDAAERGARRILAVADKVDRRTATALLDAGASGVVAAMAPDEVLLPALRAVDAGFIVLPEAARQAVRNPVLTARQQDIMRLVVLGLSNAQIAHRLYLTESTVKTHLRAVFTKLEVGSRKEAVDVLLDATSPLGRGVLGIVGAGPSGEDYRPPQVS
jgi:DNA-binding NarL/FixJ family response regulator